MAGNRSSAHHNAAQTPRLPQPIDLHEQERIFRRLPDYLAPTALFAVNTGLRDSNLCGVQWSWEVPITELDRSVFVVPAHQFKSRRAHVVILNDAAWSIIEMQRGKHPIWVFPHHSKRVNGSNNTEWQRARRAANLADFDWTFIACIAMALFLAATLASCGNQEEAKLKKAAAEVKQKAVAGVKALEATAKDKEAQETAVDAYIYAYPLVTMEITRRVSTNFKRPEGSQAPMGQFARLRNYPAVDDHTVTAPNADTLDTVVWLDVSKEPWIVSIPDMKGRYFLFTMLDAWTNVFQDPGKRTTGTKAQRYAITGPGWKGTLPRGVTEYRSPTGMVWIVGRIYCTGSPEDYRAVRALQDEVSAVPLSAFGKPYTPPPGTVDPAIDAKASPRSQVSAMDGASYFTLFAELLKTNPPAPNDAPTVAKLAEIGIVPGQDFDASRLDPAVAEAIASAPRPALAKIKSWMKESVVAGGAKVDNGWLHWTTVGRYGTEYRQRAMVTYYGLGANLPQDAVYPISEGPDIHKWYSGEHNYVMHFNRGELPPVDGFWSLTMYDANYFFVPNALNRYTLSGRNRFKANADGSVDLYLQHDSPGGDKEANWLPAPADTFVLMMRLYWPKQKPPSLLDGTWKVPEATEVQ